ncbi:MAG: hypothetical protein ACFFFT_13225 [Candidatus Thorarchaeota archaeon]
MIQELMIINEAGIAVFYHNFVDVNDFDDQQSLAGYFDIICRFTKQSFKESLRMLTLDSYIFFFYTHKSNYHIVLKCMNEELDKKLLEDIAEIILESFLIKYDELLENFTGEVSNFKSFAKTVQDIVSTKIPDFKKSIPLAH